MPQWRWKDRLLADDSAPVLMGVLNVTPDSFSDGGRFFEPETAVDRGLQLERDGAAVIDIGGESSRPGAARVELDEERRRVLPVLQALLERSTLPISIDTAKPALARAAIDQGAAVVNDIGGLRDPEMLAVVAQTDAAVVVMHMAGTPQTMQDDPRYDDVVREVHDALARRVEAATSAGIARHRIAIDPGIGFGKRSAHNLALLRNLGHFRDIGCAILVGTSRKSFLGKLTNRPVSDRLASSIASSLAAIEAGAQIVRVHDVAAMADALAVWKALREGR